MKRSFNIPTILLTSAVLAVSVLFPGVILSQDDAAGDEPFTAAFSEDEDAAVKAILTTNPTTIDQLMDCAVLFNQLWRNDLAKVQLMKIMAKNPSEADWLRLHENSLKTSPGYLQQFIRVAELQPVGEQVADLINEAIKNSFESDQAVAKSLQAFLSSAVGTEDNVRAYSDLQRGGTKSVTAMIGILGDASKSSSRRHVMLGLAQFGAEAQGPLIAALDSENPQLVKDIIAILGHRHDAVSSAYILGFRGTTDGAAESALARMKVRPLTDNEACTALIQAAQRSLEGIDPAENESLGQALIWTWDSVKKVPMASLESERMARCLRALRLSRGAAKLLPNNDTARNMYWACLAEYMAQVKNQTHMQNLSAEGNAAENASLEKQQLETIQSVYMNPTPEEDRVPRFNQLMTFSLDRGYYQGARLACTLLALTKSPAALVPVGSGAYGFGPAPLIRALNSPFEDVRWSACEAIMAIDPKGPYYGSSELPKALAMFIRSDCGGQYYHGTKFEDGVIGRVLIVSPKMEDSLRLAGMLPSQFEGVAATTGSQALRMLQESSDYVAVLYSMESYSTPPAIFMERLRAIPAAAMVPVGLMAREADFLKARSTVANKHLCTWFPRPTNDRNMERAINLLDQTREYPIYSPLMVRAKFDQSHKAMRYAAYLAEKCYGQESRVASTNSVTNPAGNPSDDKSAADNSAADNTGVSESASASTADTVTNDPATSAANPADNLAENSADKPVVDREQMFVYRGMYDLSVLVPAVENRLNLNQFSDDAIKMLACIPTNSAQSGILAYASNGLFPLANREAAAKGFDASVRRFGLLMTTVQIARQYVLTNEEQDEKSRELLETCLDYMERPWWDAKKAQLKYQPPIM